MVAGQAEDISVVLANFNAIATVLNGGIDNANINAAAAIAISKLAGYPADSSKALLGDGSWGSAGMTLATALPGSPTNGQIIALTDSLTAPTYVWPLRYNSTAAKWQPYGEGWGYNTSLPSVAAGVDGVTAVLVDSLTAPTYVWRFRYNAGSASSYKWEFVGGVIQTTQVIASYTSGSGSGTWEYTGTNLVIPRAGDYDIRWSGKDEGNGAGSTTDYGVGFGASPASSTYYYTGANNGHAFYRHVRNTGMTASTAVGLYIRDSDSTRRNPWSQRTLEITPVRVS